MGGEQDEKIVIFAGTTEGRRLSEILADAGIAHTVCVATEYGEIVMREQTDAEAAGTKGQPLVSLHRGRMDRQQMEEFLRNEGYEIVVDATHPYAQVVTENIQDAVKTQSSIYLRLEREISETPEAENPVVSIRYFESNADCAKALENTEGNILLTTGSKELSTYCASGRLHDRLYVRILPGRESLELCMEQGIKGRQILALQGPFSTEMNAAILKQYDIHHMVTKNSGRTGGYQEKLEAAKILGIPVYVIQPAKKAVDTYSFAEICGKLEQLCDCKLSGQGSMEICLAGIGMGSKNGQTQEVQHAIETADILLGAERMIERYSAKIEKKTLLHDGADSAVSGAITEKRSYSTERFPSGNGPFFRGYRILQRMQEAICGIAGSRCRRSVERRSTDPAGNFFRGHTGGPSGRKL